MIRHLLTHGEASSNRTGVDTLSVFGYQARYDLRGGFPLLTTKRVPWRSVVGELLWFLSGSTNKRDLQARGVTIWDEWGDAETGDLGPIYGHQWRNFGGSRALGGAATSKPLAPEAIDATPAARPEDDQREIPPLPRIVDAVAHRTDERVEWRGVEGVDQIRRLVDQIRTVVADPSASVGRRLILTAWNPADIDAAALPPCHVLAQFSVRRLPVTLEGGVLSEHLTLHCHLYQRSADAFLGVPFNIASYALLTHMLAKVCKIGVGELIHSFGDLHLYVNHADQARELLTREPRPRPRLILSDVTDIDGFTADSIELSGYDPHPAIAAEVAV